VGRALGGLPRSRGRHLTGVDPWRRGLLTAWQAGVGAVRGETLLASHSRVEGDIWSVRRAGQRLVVPLPARGGSGRLRVIGAGKAAAALARGLEAVLGDRLDDGLVVVKHGHLEPLSRIALAEGGHPVPDAASERAAARLLQFIGLSRSEDTYIVLLTGGASAVLEAPVPGITLEDLLRVTQRLLACGAPIDQVNRVRRHLSALKGGKLATQLAPARFATFAISDVPGDDPATLGSGPTVRDPSPRAAALAVLQRYGKDTDWPARVWRYLESPARNRSPGPPAPDGNLGFMVLANLRDAMDAAGGALRGQGWEVEDLGRCLDGDVAERASGFAVAIRERLARRSSAALPLALLAGGEPTVRLRGAGSGGRCQEFALRVARELAGVDGVTLLAAGTDGTDGPTAHAGGFADGGTWHRATSAGLVPGRCLAANDSSPVLAAAGDLLTTGPTGTNVADLLLAVIR
jgi:glycerate 2-kinase